MLKKQIKNSKWNRGQALVGVLASATVGFIIIAQMGRGLMQSNKMERGIASNMEMTEITSLFHLMTDSVSACSRSGLVGVNVSSLLAPSPSAVPIELDLNGITIKRGNNLGNTRIINGLNLVKLADIGNANFIGAVELTTNTVGQLLSSRSKMETYYLRLEVNMATKRITACSASQLLGTGDGENPSMLPKLAHEFVVSLATLRNYNSVLTNRCDHLIQTSGDPNGSWLFFASACRRYCNGCNPNMMHCTGTIEGKGYTTGYAAECDGTTNNALCICVP